mgnify:CR=1 FL=1
MDEDFNEKLNMDELYKQKQESEEHKIKIYQRVLARAHKKIKATSRMRNSDKFTFFLLPEFILGVPRYNMVECTSYVIEKLIDNGFMIKYTHPNLLFISWKHYIPYYERTEYKKKTGINIDGFGNVITKKSKKKESENINNLLLKNSEKPTKVKKTDFKDISSYKPTGKFIYDKETIKTIQTINL